MKKAEERQREHEIVYEKKLVKERSKEDHMYADKDKFVTSAYKKKLAEQAKWMEEERIRQLREEKEDVSSVPFRSASSLLSHSAVTSYVALSFVQFMLFNP